MPRMNTLLPPVPLRGYDRTIPYTSQPSGIPIAFLDAMSVRESVFVEEQKIPLVMEADADDSRSVHFIAYSNSSESKQVPAGTLRLVPFPHDPHPLPGSSWDIPTDFDPEDGTAATLDAAAPKWIVDRKTTIHDGVEPYLKLGRWAVIKEFRGQGIAKALVVEALKWAREHPRFFDVGEVEGGEGIDIESRRWKGLVCVHAQRSVEGGWRKLGFEIDDGMGIWYEAGIEHVGMWLRLDVGAS